MHPTQHPKLGCSQEEEKRRCIISGKKNVLKQIKRKNGYKGMSMTQLCDQFANNLERTMSYLEQKTAGTIVKLFHWRDGLSI